MRLVFDSVHEYYISHWRCYLSDFRFPFFLSNVWPYSPFNVMKWYESFIHDKHEGRTLLSFCRVHVITWINVRREIFIHFKRTAETFAAKIPCLSFITDIENIFHTLVKELKKNPKTLVYKLLGNLQLHWAFYTLQGLCFSVDLEVAFCTFKLLYMAI